MSSSTSIISLVCLLIIAIDVSQTIPVINKRTRSKPKSVSILDYPGLLNPMSHAFTSKVHSNVFLASAYHLPYAHAPLAGIGMGTGLTSYANMATGGVAPYLHGGYGYGAGIIPGAYSNNHQSYYSNHMGFPNGYNVNTKSSYIPNQFGYPMIGGQKATYSGVKSHLGGVSQVSGINYKGHDGIGHFNYGTHKEHVSVPGMSQVTYTHRYPTLPAFGMYPGYGHG